MKLSNLYLVGGLVALIGISSFNQPFNNAHAALTAPTNYNYSYRQSNVDTVSGNNWAIRNNGGSAYSSLPTYTQTYDGQYYDYVHSGTQIVSGLTVSHTFNNSSTSWSQVSGSTYRPNNAATFIGSNSLSGTTIKKVYLTFNNQTNKNYYLYFDLSSTGLAFTEFRVLFNDNYYVGGWDTNNEFPIYYNKLAKVLIPSYFKVEIFTHTVGAERFFDAWYLLDLGVSAAYEAGVEDGIIQGEQGADSTVLLDAVETVVGVAINFILMIMTFSIFDISLLNIALVLVAILGIVWILKALRG